MYVRKLACVLCLFACIPFANSQSTSLILPQLTACPGNQVTVSLMAENLLNVGAITLYIGYDTAVLAYLGHGNSNLQFPGIMTNAVTTPLTQVSIAWSSLTPGSITNGILVDLYFVFITDSCLLHFNPDGEIVDINMVPITYNEIEGSVGTAPPYLTVSPQNTIVTEGEDAVFQVFSDGADLYQWQERDGTDWLNLINNGTYQNVATSQLTIADATLALNDHWYRCALSANAGCQVFSDSALLTVLPVLTALVAVPDTLACSYSVANVPFRGYGIDNIIGFGIDVAYNPAIAEFASLGSIHPLLQGVSAAVFTAPVPHISIVWSSGQGVTIPDGPLFDLVFEYTNGETGLFIMNSTYFTRADMLAYNLLVHNGSIARNFDPDLLFSPSDTTVLTGSPAFFSTLASAAIAYQWLESDDNGFTWDFLDDGLPYSGSQSPVLKIDPVTGSLNLHQFKCLVSGATCDTTTDVATLFVDTLTNVSDQMSGKLCNMPFMVHNQRFTTHGFSVLVGATESGNFNIAVYDLPGRKIHQAKYSVYSPGKLTIDGDLPNLVCGTYIIEYEFKNRSEVFRVCYKINLY